MKRLNGFFGVILFVAAGWAMAGAGCASLEDAGCESDADCRFGRVCVDGMCTGGVDIGNNPTTNNATTNNATTNNSGNNGSVNNATTNNGVVNNGSTNNGNIGSPCRPTGNCGDNLICSVDGECVPFCEDSGGCMGGDVCIENGCVEPRACELVEAQSGPGFCVAFWDCTDGGETGVFCEGNPEQIVTCTCFDAATGMEQSFQPDIDGACEFDQLVELANNRCGLRVPAEEG